MAISAATKERMSLAHRGSRNANWSPEPGYQGVHHRLRKQEMGPCVDCGGPARDWSLRSDTPADRLRMHYLPGRNWKRVAYSINLSDYEPRCRKCHQQMDGIKPWTSPRHYGARTHCKWGHPYSPENTKTRAAGGRVCITCQVSRDRARWGKARTD
jgi:hypothetical protein